MINVGKGIITFVNITFCALLLTTSIVKLAYLPEVGYRIESMVQENENNYNVNANYNQQFDCEVAQEYSPKYYSSENNSTNPDNGGSKSDPNYVNGKENFYNIKDNRNNPPKYRCTPSHNRYSNKFYTPNYNGYSSYDYYPRYNGNNNHVYNPVSRWRVNSFYSWAISDKILNSIYTLFSTIGFLALEFQIFNGFFTTNLPFLLKLAGRGTSYILIGMLSFEQNDAGIIIPIVTSLFGIILIIFSFFFPEYIISGIVPHKPKALILDTQEYESLPNYEEKPIDVQIQIAEETS